MYQMQEGEGYMTKGLGEINRIKRVIDDLRLDEEKYTRILHALSGFETEDSYSHYVIKRNDTMTLLLLAKQRLKELEDE